MVLSGPRRIVAPDLVPSNGDRDSRSPSSRNTRSPVVATAAFGSSSAGGSSGTVGASRAVAGISAAGARSSRTAIGAGGPPSTASGTPGTGDSSTSDGGSAGGPAPQTRLVLVWGVL